MTHSTAATAPTHLRAHPDDNVVIIVTDIRSGTELLEGVVTRRNHVLGQKVALVDISAGDQVLRYGASIGSASADIVVGEFVHDHNLVSNYQRATTRRGEGQ